MNRGRNGFTLIELLVVVAFIAVLISLLLPALSQARDKAKGVSCMSNLRQVGFCIQRYLDDYRNTMYASYTTTPSPGYSPWWVWSLYLMKYFPALTYNSSQPNTWSEILNCPVAKALALAAGPTKSVGWTYLRMRNSPYWDRDDQCTASWINFTRIEAPSRKIFLIDGLLAQQDLIDGTAGKWVNAATNYDCIAGEYYGSGGAGFIHGSSASCLFADWHVESHLRYEVTKDLCNQPYP